MGIESVRILELLWIFISRDGTLYRLSRLVWQSSLCGLFDF